MTKSEFLEVFQEWNTDADYRRHFSADPVSALREKGIILSMKEESLLRTAPWLGNDLTPQELQEKISNALGMKLPYL